MSFDISDKRISFKSLRNLDFFMQNKCPYISMFIKLLEDIGNHFYLNQEIINYFSWNKDVVDLEKECFYQFIENIKNMMNTNPFYSIEHALEHVYLYSKSFKTIEKEFSEKPQFKRGISYQYLKNNHHII
jgi:hypothetical protein